MNAKYDPRQNLSETEIDCMVIAEADDNSAWEEPVQVHKASPVPLSLSAGLAARAAFLARLHRKTNLQEWLTNIIEERIELEEAAFVGAKHELANRLQAPDSLTI